MVPPVAVQFTAMFVVPVTDAVNCCVPFTSKLVVAGLSATAIDAGTGVGVGVGLGVGFGVGFGVGVGVGVGVGGGAVVVTVTVAWSNLVVSAWLVAVTVNVPAALGAVYMPDEEMAPPVADQVTVVFVALLTVAVNCCCPPTCRGTLWGVMATETALGVLETELTLPLKPQPPMAKMNWRKNNVSKIAILV